MGDKAGVGSLVMLVVAASLAEREVAIDGPADYVGIAVVLAIILPPANLAKLQGLRQSKCFVSATLAAGRSGSSHAPSMRRSARHSESVAVIDHYDGNPFLRIL
jgi:hypothetical protein